MRSIFLLGGFVGFLVVAVAGWLGGRSADRILIDASVACLVSALLFRWFWSRVVVALTDTVKKKRAIRQAAEEAGAAAKAVPVVAIKTK